MVKQENHPWYFWRDKSLFLSVYLQPRAASDAIVGVHDNHLKIRLTAPPLEGRANRYLIKFLARCFNVPESQITILRGEHSRKKHVRIDSPDDLSVLELT